LDKATLRFSGIASSDFAYCDTPFRNMACVSSATFVHCDSTVRRTNLDTTWQVHHNTYIIHYFRRIIDSQGKRDL